MTDEQQNASYQLIFGILALQNDFITREQLLGAFTRWIADKTRPIEQYLSESGILPEDERGLVASLAKKHIAKHGDDAEKSLGRFGADLSPLLTGLNALGDVDLETSVKTFESEFETKTQILVDDFIATDRSNSSRYEVVSGHAKGGLGEVFKAMDKELQREVALKEIQSRYADDPESRARFVLEAEITGSLEHPGIVPVYGLGQYQDGRPYYAMKFIHGNSLRQLTDQYFSKVGTKANTRDRQWRQLVGSFVSVCKAIEYAHSRGVIHRDIKPSNIMAGRFGETLVVDWGLAKVRGRQEGAHDNGETTLKPSSGDSSSGTRVGSALGTPAYMSPEQAQGRVDELGPASDIYSLGATLYYILTGQAPFFGKDVASTLTSVSQGDFLPPRKVRPAIARSLSAVCEKAMATDLSSRYESAQALAEDVELWLADEPVTACQGTLSERSGRWMRRNRGLVQSSVVALVIISLISSLSAYWFMQLKSEAENAQSDAELAQLSADSARIDAEELAKQNNNLAIKNLDLAEKNALERENALAHADEQRVEADKARRLSDFLIRTFQAADPIGQGAAPGFLPKEKGGELTAREMLDLGAERIMTDEELLNHPLSRAAVMDAIGDAYRQLGFFDQAEPLLMEALEVRRQLLPPDHADLAVSLHNLGWYYHERGNYPKAEPLYADALQLRRQLKGDEGRRLEANTLHNMAWMLANEGRGEEAKELTLQAIAIRTKVLGATHRDTVFSQFALCFVLIEQDQFLDALTQIAKVALNLPSLEADPKVSDAALYFAYGVINRNVVGLTVSETQLRRALNSGIEGLGAGNVYVGVIRCELGATLEAEGKIDEALEQYRLATEIARQRVAMEHPRVRILVNRYADLLRKEGRVGEGKQLWDEFMIAQRRRFDPRYGQVLEAAYGHGVFLREAQSYDEALDVFADIVTTVERSQREQSGYRYVPGTLGNCRNQQGLCLLDQSDDFGKASEFFRMSIRDFQEDVALDANELPGEIAWPQINLVSALTQMADFDTAETELSSSQENMENLRSSQRRGIETYHHQTALDLYSASGKRSECLQVAVVLRKRISRDANDLMSVCRTLCRVAQGSESIDAVQKSLIAEALKTLAMALDTGYDPKKAAALKDLRILKSEPRYQTLMAD